MINTPLFTREGQSLYLSRTASFVKGGVLFPPTANLPVTITARSAGSLTSSPPIILESPTDSYNEVLALIGRSADADNADVKARLMVEPKTYAYGERALCNYPILANHVFGTRENPFYLDDQYSDSLLLKPQQLLSFRFLNGSTAGSSNYSIAAQSTKIQNKALGLDKALAAAMAAQFIKGRWLTPYWFTMESELMTGLHAVQVAAAGRQNVTFTNKDTSNLILTSLMMSVVTAGVAGDTNQYCTYELFHPDTEQAMQDQPVAMNCGAGTAEFPYRFPAPIIIKPRQTMTVKLNSLITDATIDVYMTFFGMAAFLDPENPATFGPTPTIRGM